MTMNLGQKIFGFLFLLCLIGGIGWLWLALQQPEISAVERRLSKAVSEQGTLTGAHWAAQATLESAKAGMSTLQADVVTVQAIGVELSTMEAQMATSVAVGAEQAVRIGEIEDLLYETPPVESQFAFGRRELYLMIALAMLVAVGFIVATLWKRPPGSSHHDDPGPVNPRSFTSTTRTTPAYMKRKNGPNNTRR